MSANMALARRLANIPALETKRKNERLLRQLIIGHFEELAVPQD